MAVWDIVWTAPLDANTTASAGKALVPTGNGYYVVATSSNRASYGRTAGICLRNSDPLDPAPMAVTGIVDKTVTGLGTGSASWVRVNASGSLERCTPSGADDIVGYCRTDGTLHLICNVLTAAIVNGGGVGGYIANTDRTVADTKGTAIDVDTSALRPAPPGTYNVQDLVVSLGYSLLDPTGATDCTAAVRAAIVYVKQHTLTLPSWSPPQSWKAGGVILFPPGNFRFSSTLTIDGSVTIRGAHGGMDWGSTNWVFDENIGGNGACVWFYANQSPNDGTGTYGFGSALENITIIQQRTAGRDLRNVNYGILVQAAGVTLKDVSITNVQGDGLVVGKPYQAVDYGNANLFKVEGHCRIMMCDRYGVSLQGNDGSAFTFSGLLDVSTSGSYGIANRCFLGGHFDAIHTSSNGYLISGGAWYLRSSGAGVYEWSAGASVTADGSKLYVPTVANAPKPLHNCFSFLCTTSGTTGGTEPNWSSITDIGQTINDGTAVWTSYAEVGGTILHTGAANRSTYDYVYEENDQLPIHATGVDNTKGTAGFGNGYYDITPESRVIYATGFYRTLPQTTQGYQRRADNTVLSGVEIGVGTQGSALHGVWRSAENGTYSDSADWAWDWGQRREVWDITRKAWVNEAYYSFGSTRYPSFLENGFRSLPYPGAIRWPSLWVGGVEGTESRVTALKAKSSSPYAPDFTSKAIGASGMFEKGDLVINHGGAGRAQFPALWRARQRVSTVSSGDIWCPLGWAATTTYFLGCVIQEGTAYWRCVTEGTGPGALTGNVKPAFATGAGTTYTESTGLVWEWAGSTTATDAENWDPIIAESPTTLEKSVAGSSNVTLTADEAAHSRFKFTGALTGNIYVVVEGGGAGSWTRTFWNATSGAFTLEVRATAGGVGVVVASGAKVILYSDGTDVYSTSTGGASVAGSNTQVQFNDGGAFGADADFTWDKANNRLAVTGGVSMGSTVATTGTQRVADGFTLYGRNDTNTGNIPIIDFSGNALSYGDATVEGMTHNVGAAYSHAFQVNSLSKLTVSSSATTCQSTVFTCNDVTIGSTYVQIGATTASTGGLRVGDGWTAYGRTGGAGNACLFNWYATSDALYIGNTSGGASQVVSTIVNGSSNVYLSTNAVERITVTTSEIATSLPLAGYSGGNKPFRLKVATKSFSDLTDYTLVPSEYSCPIQRYSDSGGGPGSGTKNIIGPTEDGAIFFVDNRMSATNVTFKTAAGSGPTISNTSGRALVYCDGTNYVLLNDIVA